METAVKVSIGKMTLSAPFDDLFPNQLQSNGFELLPVKVEHTSAVAPAFSSSRPPQVSRATSA